MKSLPRLWSVFGAGNEVRTRDLNLGKVALYQLSYSRIRGAIVCTAPGLSSGHVYLPPPCPFITGQAACK